MSENERPPASDALSHEEWLALLAEGDVEIEGRMPWSSNATFLVSVTSPTATGRAIYKPLQGEYPLWDFPEGLYRYEVAAYELSDALGFGVVPETIARDVDVYGQGSLQRFVDADFEQHYFTMMEHPRHLQQLRRIAGFDLLLNNADRKGGHLLIDADEHIYGIDNGLCFHTQPKLRTVMWDFAWEEVPDDVKAAAEQLSKELPDAMCMLLSEREQRALQYRAKKIVQDPLFPEPDLEGRPYPWPRI